MGEGLTKIYELKEKKETLEPNNNHNNHNFNNNHNNIILNIEYLHSIRVRNNTSRAKHF